ncbi:translocation protein Sec62-domain-containing protein [Schizophyllum amplum]|uniref:Translocation protein SEC62 n=1 Tax=Schizophyllum amplum TaxID=97359 RepID=A0A550CFT7_9AGAR|nr:translocation protein Sec62-domain-containing protein [Auriculariopsis ampla]
MEQQQQKAPADIKQVAVFLRSGSAGLKVRVGTLNGKRFDYFRAKSAIKALTSPAYAKQKNVPKVTNEAEALDVLKRVNQFAFFLRVQRGAPTGSSSSSPKALQIIAEQQVAPEEYYAWFYDGPQWMNYVMGAGLVICMFGAVLFPLWPPSLRLGVYYLSMGMLGLLGLFFAIAIVRLIFYIISVIVASPGIWIFPKLFADVGFVESFIPLWEWDLPKKKKGKKEKGEKSEKGGKKRSKEGKLKEKAAETSPAPAGGVTEPSAAPTAEAKSEEVVDSGLSRPPSAQEVVG